jgi:PadR family transcriptional regulator PadR
MGKDLLGEFELMVLLAATRLGEDGAYALAIVDDISERSGRSVRRAAVYVTLKRLEQKGFISTWLGEPRAERGGKSRRHVRIEPQGAVAVHESRTALENMWAGLDTIVEGS